MKNSVHIYITKYANNDAYKEQKIGTHTYRGADKSLARPGRKKLQRQKILMFIYPIYYHN